MGIIHLHLFSKGRYRNRVPIGYRGIDKGIELRQYPDKITGKFIFTPDLSGPRFS